ncbi:MAG TPA: putative glycoside hydrolase [Anaerolineae bacterium]|nr:putative glycoside hydrolase [Anaerolineae bacterium]HPL29990.1 putative glycoside hydrolase [Anaerolineae bacterium]
MKRVLAISALAVILCAAALAALVLMPAAQGRVTDAESGQPLAGATVGIGGDEFVTGAEGTFAVRGLSRLAAISAQAPGYQTVSGATIPGGLVGLQQTLTIALEPLELSGKVYDAFNGAPLAGAAVRAGERELATDGQGRYVFKRLLPGAQLLARAVHYGDSAPLAYEGQATHDFGLTLLPTTVTVQDQESGQPLAGAAVTAAGETAQADEHGQVTIARLEPQTELRATCAGYDEGSAQGGPGDTVTLGLKRSSVRGVVRNTDGQPVEGALVLGRASGQEPVLAYTDAEGRYELAGLPGGATLTVRKAGYGRIDRALDANPQYDFALEPFVAKGIYLAFHHLRPEYAASLRRNIDLIDRTELNAVVIEIKTETGYLGFRSQNPVAQAIGASYDENCIDTRALLADLHQRGIYTIARIPIFEDDLLATNRPEWAVRYPNGTVWRAWGGRGWTDPFQKGVWEYNVAISKEAVELGFDEVQFDYVRFPSDGSISQCRYLRESTAESRVEAITGFVAYARHELDKVGAFFSVDTFGLTTFDTSEQGVGQLLDQMAQYMDYSSPMVYPSTYLVGMLDLTDPWRQPYEVVKRSLDAAHKKTPTLIRPWLQHYDDYHGVGITYGLPEYMAQKQAAADGGASGWLWWNILGEYDERVFEAE